MEKEFARVRLDWLKWVGAPFFVELSGWPGLGIGERVAAEVRFASELEEIVGSPAAIVQALRLGGGASAPSDARAAWTAAQAAAQLAGFRGLEPPLSAHFRISLFDNGLESQASPA